MPLPTGHEIDVVEFVESGQVDPMLLDRSYYLEPESQGLKAYALLRETSAGSDRMAIAKVALRKAGVAGALHVRAGVTVLQTMRWPDEIRTADFDVMGRDVEPRKQEVQMAGSLVEQKIEGGDVTDAPASGRPTRTTPRSST